MRATLQGVDGVDALFSVGGRGVRVNTRTLAASLVPLEAEAASRFWVAPEPGDPIDRWGEIAAHATQRGRDDVAVVASGAETRAYTIPKAAAQEAARGLAWAETTPGSGTQVAHKVAALLAAGGQVELPVIRHLGRYFAHHERAVGNPTPERVSWALWGGDPASRWVASTLAKHPLTAAGDVEVNLLAFYEGDDDERSFYGECDESGERILSLFRRTDQDTWMTWFSGDWEPADEPAADAIVELDDDTAVYVAGALYDAPEIAVPLRDLDPHEWDVIQAGLSGVDWDAVDRVLVAAPIQDPTPGQYTPDERSKNASRQPRDANGRFAQVGDTGRIKKSGLRGEIATVNPVDDTVIVKAADGNSYAIPSEEFEVDGQPVGQAAPPGAQKPGQKLPPLNLDAILGQPRATKTTPKAWLKSLLPPMGPAQLKQVINNYQKFITDERLKRSKDFKGGTGWEESGPEYHSPVLDKKNSKPQRHLRGLKADGAETPPLPTPEGGPGDGDVAPVEKLNPDTSDVKPLHLAIVDKDDPRAVTDLVSMIPATDASNEPTTFRRVAGDWVEDQAVLQDLRSPTPPPVVQLDDTMYQDVLSQVDSAPAPEEGDEGDPNAPIPSTPTPAVAAAVHFEDQLIPVWGPNAQLKYLLAAGGLDRNRGNAERLRTYWLHGEGAAKIRWNTPGDWRRCVRHLSKYLGTRAKGYCALRHKEATGMWTGDRRHRQGFGLVPGVRDLDSTMDVLSTRQVIRASAEIARRNVARARVFGVGAYDGEPVLDPEQPENITEQRQGRAFVIPLLIPEGIESGDGRTFDVGSLGMRQLPLPLLWQIKTGEGHDGSVLVGRIDKVDRIDGGLGNATGVFDTGPYGQEAQRLVEQGMLRWVSADLDRFEAEEEELSEDDDSIKSKKMRIKKGRLMGATLVAKPAFQEATIELVPLGETITIEDGVYVESPNEVDAQALVAAGATTSRIPVHPPAAWFDDPQLDHATPLTITNDGRVFGHIAAWDVDHIGMPFGTRAPRSASGYAYFHTGVVETEDGQDVHVGQLTLAGGHADLTADAAAAVRHYDDTASAIADVHAGEDRYGIWVAGALRPGTSPEQVRTLRASAPSGDWRPINGRLELVAVCQVNVPGFPVARARVASGAVMALVAAGAAPLARMKGDPVQELQQRISGLEAFEARRVEDRLQEARAKVAAARKERESELSAIAAAARSRVYLALDVDGYLTEFKDFSPERREKLASEKKALKDGSFPIENSADLRRAIQAYGRADESKQASVRRHIVRRARALGKENLIPDSWSEASIDDMTLSATDAREVLTAAALQRRAEQIRGRIR